MRIFLSHSGKISREVARALNEWIPLVIQGAKPFLSTEIDKGRRWGDVIANELSKSDYGIICVTQENLTRPWLYFEGGAISKAIDSSCVSPLLFNVSPSDIKGPFEQFQLTTCNESDIWSLMRSINNRLGPEQLSETNLQQEFKVWWPRLRDKLAELGRQPIDVTQTAYPWLYVLEDLTRVHRDQIRSSVWWVTPDPFKYVLTPAMKAAIRECFQRGVKHTFIVRESEHDDDAISQLKQLAPETENGVPVIEIPDQEFDRAAVTDYVVTDPDADSMAVFLELPLAERGGYWIRVANGRCAGGFVSRFRKLLKDNSARRTHRSHHSTMRRPATSRAPFPRNSH